MIQPVTPKQEKKPVSIEMQAFLELDAMLLAAPHLDYDKELAEVRDEKYGQRGRLSCKF